MGQALECFFIGIALGIPYHTLLIFTGWWLVELQKTVGVGIWCSARARGEGT